MKKSNVKVERMVQNERAGENEITPSTVSLIAAIGGILAAALAMLC